MTNELIAKIKAEIERRLKKYATDVTMPLEALGKVILELKGILSFLSTLESEKPAPADLEDAADEMAIRAFPEKKSYSTVIDRVVDYNAVDRKNYRDGIIAGAKWQADHTPLPEDTVLFNNGVAEGKRLMMKEAEECELYWDGDFLAIDLNMAALGYSERDKVRVIIVKE